jgi:hypothetical protein
VRVGGFDRWDGLFALLAVVAFATFLILDRSLTFWHDDWAFINERLPWTLDSFMKPHNEHWVLTVALIWKPLLSTIGLKSYLPYLAVLQLAHVATAAAVYWMARRLAGPGIGLTAGVLMLCLGTAGEVLFWAQPVALVGATAAGAWGLACVAVARPARLGLGALLLVVAVATGGPGLFFVGAIAAFLILSPGRRRDLWVTAPAGIAYGAWYVAYGQYATHVQWSLSLAALRDLIDYVRIGLAHAMGAVSGLGDEVGLVLAVVLIGATVWHLLGRGPYLVLASAAIAGLVAQYTVTGLVRAEIDVTQAAAPRYVYSAGALILVAVASWLDTRRDAPRINLLPLAAVAAWAIVFNASALRWWRDEFFVQRAYETRAAIQVLLQEGGTPDLPMDRVSAVPSDPFLRNLPGPGRLRELLPQYGSPLDDPYGGGSGQVPDAVYQRVRRQILDWRP